MNKVLFIVMTALIYTSIKPHEEEYSLLVIKYDKCSAVAFFKLGIINVENPDGFM